MEPLVSCVVATRNRRPFFAQALEYFYAQSFTDSELIVVDDGDSPVADLCEGRPRVTYIRLHEPTPTGAKLNLGIQTARGSILQKIDDDDYYGPEFLSTAVAHLSRDESTETLVVWCCFAVLIAGEPELFFSGHGWHPGGTFCFRRAMWERIPFRPLFASSDSWFIRDHKPKLVRACASDQYIVVRHNRNTWHQLADWPSVEAYFRTRRPYPKSVEDLVGARHAPFYRHLMQEPRVLP